MSLIENRWTVRCKALLYSSGKHKVIGKHGGSPEEAGPRYRCDDFVLESILRQCRPAEDAAVDSGGLQAIQETANVTYRPSPGADDCRIGNQICDLKVAAAYRDGGRTAPWPELEIDPPESNRLEVTQYADE